MAEGELYICLSDRQHEFACKNCICRVPHTKGGLCYLEPLEPGKIRACYCGPYKPPIKVAHEILKKGGE